MSRDSGIIPGSYHYACILDLLGRVGILYEARDIIEKMPIKLDATVYGTLHGAVGFTGM